MVATRLFAAWLAPCLLGRGRVPLAPSRARSLCARAAAPPSAGSPAPAAARARSERLDRALVARGLVESRSQAQRAIDDGRVLVRRARGDGGGGAPAAAARAASKASEQVGDDVELSLTAPQRFVSRGGEKLAALLAHADYAAEMADLGGVHVLDVGASTGGFADCCLQHGAASVSCVDVGRAQLHPRLRGDARVACNLEGVNARRLREDARGRLPRDAFGLVVVDLSFISLTLVLGALWPFVGAAPPRAGWRGGRVALLVKPQFEGGAPGVAEVGRGGHAVRSAAERDAALARVSECAAALPGCAVLGSIRSPVRGAKAGNREFLLVLEKTTADGAAAPSEPASEGPRP